MNNSFKNRRAYIVAAIMLSGMMITGATTFAIEDTSGDGVTLATANETSGTVGITFPIAELGDCTDKAACKAYCDGGEHMDACIAFGKAHGLMSKDEADNSSKFKDSVKGGKGPGGCTSPETCKAYCSDVSHTDECVAFSEQHGFKGAALEKGKKLASYLKSGGKMPGGCTDGVSCKAYCTDLAHAKECSDFAHKAGIAGEVKKGDGEAPSDEQLQKLVDLAAKGETPGACKTKNECQEYCRVDSHRDECVAFGEKMGLLKSGDADRLKKLRGKGPGGCDSPDACHAFCNDEANHETCYKFAVENKLISADKLEEIKDGAVRIREGISNAPAEVQECLKSTLGEDTLADLESGDLTPGSDLALKAKSCFEKFGGQHDPAKTISSAPESVKTCLKAKLGADYETVINGKTKPTGETADAFRMCFEGAQMGATGTGKPGQGSGSEQPTAAKIASYIKSAPAPVQECLKAKLGADLDALIAGTSTVTPELMSTIRACFQSFMPQKQGGMNQGGSNAGAAAKIKAGDPTSPMQGKPGMLPPGGAIPPTMNPQLEACLKEKLGDDGFAKLKTEKPTAEVGQMIRPCFEQFGKTTTIKPSGGVTPVTGAPDAATWATRLPTPVAACVKEKMGEDAFMSAAKNPPTPDIEVVVKACFTATGTGVGTPQMKAVNPGGGMELPKQMSPPTNTDGGMKPPEGQPAETKPQAQRNVAQLLLSAVVTSFLFVNGIVK